MYKRYSPKKEGCKEPRKCLSRYSPKEGCKEECSCLSWYSPKEGKTPLKDAVPPCYSGRGDPPTDRVLPGVHRAPADTHQRPDRGPQDQPPLPVAGGGGQLLHRHHRPGPHPQPRCVHQGAPLAPCYWCQWCSGIPRGVLLCRFCSSQMSINLCVCWHFVICFMNC